MSSVRNCSVNERAERSEHLVSRWVTEAVVDGLEVVEVDHDDAQRVRLPCRPRQLALECRFQVPAVVEAGQRVVDGLLAQLRLEGEHLAFRPGALGDVHQDADEHRASAGVHGTAVGLDLDDAPVLAAAVERVFDAIDFTAQAPAELFRDKGTVALDREVEGSELADLFRRVAEDVVELGVGIDETPVVDDDDADERLADDAAELRLGLSQGARDLLVLVQSQFEGNRPLAYLLLEHHRVLELAEIGDLRVRAALGAFHEGSDHLVQALDLGFVAAGREPDRRVRVNHRWTRSRCPSASGSRGHRSTARRRC